MKRNPTKNLCYLILALNLIKQPKSDIINITENSNSERKRRTKNEKYESNKSDAQRT